MYSNRRVFDENKILLDDAVRNENYEFRISHQISVQDLIQAKVLVCGPDTRPMRIETYCSIVERWCYMNTRGLMEVLPVKPFNVYIAI